MDVLIVVTDWICIILFILGSIGNLLGLAVFSSRRFRCCSTYTTLALTSFGINLVCIIRYSLLLHSQTRRWLSDHIASSHWITCKIFRLSSSFRVLAAWITVFWVIERFIYVSSRLNILFNRREKFQLFEKYKYICMILISLIMIIIVTGPTVIFSTPIIINFNGTYSSKQCTFNIYQTSSIWKHYFQDYSFRLNYNTIRFLFSEMIPSILVALFNIAIIISILRTTAHVRRRQEYHHNKLSMSMITGTTSKLPQIHIYDASQQQQPQQHVSIRASSIKRSSISITSIPFGKMSWMNIVLILHSLLFFLSSSITSIVYFSTSDMKIAIWMSVIILANCSLNFYVYCLSGRQFRMEIKRILKRYMRNCHKKLIRRCFRQYHRRHSATQNGKDQIYQVIAQRQQQNFPFSNIRQYQIMERIK